MTVNIESTPGQPTFQSLKRGVLTVPDVVFTSVATQAPGGAVALNFFFAILLAGAGFPLALLVALISQVITNLINPVIGFSIPWQVVDIIFIAIIWFFAYTGIKGSARVAIVTGTIEVTIFLILGFLLVARAGSANTLSVFTPSTGFFGLAWGLIFGFLSFTGFESVASLAEETANPKKQIGRSAFFALLAVGIFYVFLAYAGVVGWGLDKLTGGSGPAYLPNDTFAF